MNFWWIFIIGHYIKFIKSQASIKRKVLSTCQFSSIYIGFAAIYHHLPHLGTSPDQDFWGIMGFFAAHCENSSRPDESPTLDVQ